VGEAFHETTGVAYTFIPNAVDHESLKRDALRTLNVHTELDLPPEAYLVLTVGRIDDQKNYPCVLRCARQLVSWDPTIHLICVGDGLRFGQMLQLRDTMGLRGNVHFLGRRDDVPALMARAHAFLLLSRNEGMPRVVAEAMLSGLPVVATAVDGTPEMMDDGMEGFLVPDDDDQLAAQRVMQIRKDPVLASAMAAAGRIRAERNHTLGPLGAAVSSVYDDLLTT
jgi:glycosyltransferase involved in cell wall biosynthesis